eukprot:6213884-Amphidinium_carterae.1
MVGDGSTGSLLVQHTPKSKALMLLLVLVGMTKNTLRDNKPRNSIGSLSCNSCSQPLRASLKLRSEHRLDYGETALSISGLTTMHLNARTIAATICHLGLIWPQK